MRAKTKNRKNLGNVNLDLYIYKIDPKPLERDIRVNYILHPPHCLHIKNGKAAVTPPEGFKETNKHTLHEEFMAIPAWKNAMRFLIGSHLWDITTRMLLMHAGNSITYPRVVFEAVTVKEREQTMSVLERFGITNLIFNQMSAIIEKKLLKEFPQDQTKYKVGGRFKRNSGNIYELYLYSTIYPKTNKVRFLLSETYIRADEYITKTFILRYDATADNPILFNIRNLFPFPELLFRWMEDILEKGFGFKDSCVVVLNKRFLQAIEDHENTITIRACLDETLYNYLLQMLWNIKLYALKHYFEFRFMQ